MDSGFEAAVEQYADMIFRLAFSYLRNRADAEDVMQETLLKLYTQKKPFDSPEHQRYWLVRVAVQAPAALPLAADRAPGGGTGDRGFRHPGPVGVVPAGDGSPAEIPGGGVPLLL